MPGSVSPEELIWTVGMAISLLANGWLLRGAARTRAALRRRGVNGARRLAIGTRLIVHGLLTAMGALGTAVGALQGTRWPGEPPDWRAALTLPLLLVYGLIPAAIGVIWTYRQERLLRYAAAGDGGPYGAQLDRIETTATETRDIVRERATREEA